MNQLETLEAKSVHILREAYRSLGNVCMLWSIGKDSTVLLHLARKAFFGHVPIPLVHIDTAYKMPEMIEYRDKLALEWRLNLVVGQNREALKEKLTFPDGNVDRIACCRNLKTMALKHTLDGEWPRLNLEEALHRDPDVILYPQSESFFPGLDEFAQLPGWRDLRAVKNRQMYCVSETITFTSPRLIEALEQVADILHPRAGRGTEGSR